MKLLLEIVLLIVLGILSYQDFKERAISVWVLGIGFFSGGILHITEKGFILFSVNTLLNCIIITLIFGVLYIYAKFKMKQAIFNVFGLGDLLFFFLLAVSLPIVSFLVVFVFSLIFSLIIFFIIKKQLIVKTIPLAGLQSVFLGITLVVNKVFNLTIYQL